MSSRVRGHVKNDQHVKPLVTVFVNLMVFIAQITWTDTLLESLSFGRRPILVRPADVQYLGYDGPGPTVSCEDIGGKGRADDVAQMGSIVHIWQGGSDQDVWPVREWYTVGHNEIQAFSAPHGGRVKK